MTKVSDVHVQGDDHAQVERSAGTRHVQGRRATTRTGTRRRPRKCLPDPLTAGARWASPGPPRDRTGPHQTAPYRYSHRDHRRVVAGLPRDVGVDVSRPLDEDRRADPIAASSPARAVPRPPADGRRAGARPRRRPAAGRDRSLPRPAAAGASHAPARPSSTRRRSPTRTTASRSSPAGASRSRSAPQRRSLGGRRRRGRGRCPPDRLSGKALRDARERPESGRTAHRRPGRRCRRSSIRPRPSWPIRQRGRPRRPGHVRARRGRRSRAASRREVFGFLPYWELSDSSTTARLGEDLDRRLLRRRRRRQGQPQEEEQRRLDDRRLERLDQLEDDRASSTPRTRATPGSC